MRTFTLLCLFALVGVPAFAQGPTKTNVSIGAMALGLGLTSQGTPATDVVSRVSFTKAVSLRQDSLLSGDGKFQYFGGGFEYPLPAKLLSRTSLGKLAPYLDGTVGAERLLPTGKPTASHIAFMAGAGLRYTAANGIQVSLVEVNWGHFPNAPFGHNAAVVSGGLSYAFGKH